MLQQVHAVAQHASTTATLFTDFITDNVRPQTHRDKLHPVVYSQRTDTLSFTTGAATVPTVKRGRSKSRVCRHDPRHGTVRCCPTAPLHARQAAAAPRLTTFLLACADVGAIAWMAAERRRPEHDYGAGPAPVPAPQAPSVA